MSYVRCYYLVDAGQAGGVGGVVTVAAVAVHGAVLVTRGRG